MAHLTMKSLTGSSQNLMYDQMILEYWNKDEPNSGWIHVAVTTRSQEENIKQNLRAYKDEDNKTQYKPMYRRCIMKFLWEKLQSV